MTLMRVAAHDGHVLTYDTADAENVHIETPRDVHETGVTERGAVLRELGQEHLVLRIDFKEGKGSRWVDQATAALPDLRVGGELLRAALDAEGIPADVASRIWNRFFYGRPGDFSDEGSIILRNAGHGRVERHDDGRIVIHHRQADEEATDG